MKLVDSDEVVRIVREEVKDEDNTLPVSFRAGVDYVLKIMNELPPVDAIPVEWINKYIVDNTQRVDEVAGLTVNYNTYPRQIAKMLTAWWEKENE